MVRGAECSWDLVMICPMTGTGRAVVGEGVGSVDVTVLHALTGLSVGNISATCWHGCAGVLSNCGCVLVG